MTSDGQWLEYRALVLASMAASREGHNNICNQITKLREEVAVLKWKSGIWGAAAGMLPAMLVAVMMFLGRM